MQPPKIIGTNWKESHYCKRILAENIQLSSMFDTQVGNHDSFDS